MTAGHATPATREPPLIGILGGTFDPIHHGHLRPALEVRQTLGLAEVRFIPLAVAVHRHPPQASPAQRLAMLGAALGDQPGLRVDAREIRRPGRSYTLDTLASLRRDLPQAHLCLLLGRDAYRAFLTWHRPLEILELAHLIVMERPGEAPPDDPRLTELGAARACPSPDDLRQASHGRILFQPVTQLAISATQIRHLLAEGKSPRFLLPDPVLDIIRREGLYGCPTAPTNLD